MRQVKTLSRALVAVLALSAVVASVASASDLYTASSYPTTITGTSAIGNDTFHTEAGTVECRSHFQATLTGTSSQMTVVPNYTECKAFGFLSATVKSSCHYLDTTPIETSDGSVMVTTHYTCTGSNEPIYVEAGTCKMTIGPQGPLNSITFTNTGSGDVLMKANVTGIAYTVTQDGFGCPFAGTGAKAGGSYVQHSSITLDSTNGANIHIR